MPQHEIVFKLFVTNHVNLHSVVGSILSHSLLVHCRMLHTTTDFPCAPSLYSSSTTFTSHSSASSNSDAAKMEPTLTLPSVINTNDLLAQHDARLDLLVAKITSALQLPNAGADALAKHALDAATSPSATPKSTRELLARALRKTALNVLKSGSTRDDSGLAPNTVARSKAFDTTLALIDATIVLVRRRQLDAVLTLALLEYVFTFHTQTELADRITSIRLRYEAFRAAEPEKVADFYMIKSVMSCINRDQPGCNPLLSGHLRLMLAASLPVWHASGMNRRAQINSANVPDYHSVLDSPQLPGVDIALYKAFWRAQTLMAEPSMAESAAQWREAHDAMTRVLLAFETIPVSEQADSDLTASPKNGKTTHDLHRIPKYLTAPTILRLQMSDVQVRRHILMQYAIFLHHLQVMSTHVASSKDTPNSRACSIFCKSLFEPNAEGIKLQERVYSVLEEDCAGKFKRFAWSLLQRERRWITWKKHTGHGHLSVKGAVAPTVFKRRKVQTKSGDAASMARSRMLASRNWTDRQLAWKAPSAPVQREAVIERGRSEFWSMDVLKMELKEDRDDEELTEDIKRKNDSKYLWRTLRMVSEENLDYMVDLADEENDNGLDLDVLIRERKEETVSMEVEDDTQAEEDEQVEETKPLEDDKGVKPPKINTEDKGTGVDAAKPESTPKA